MVWEQSQRPWTSCGTASSGQPAQGQQSETATYEDTLQKLAQTRKQLEQAIAVVDTLHTDVAAKKKELDRVLQTIHSKEEEKQTLEQETALSRRLLQEDGDRLREVIGLYELRRSRTDKVGGFLGGVLASLVAAGIWALVGHFLRATP
jgi:flagellar motility protein MotE (MotC chaperone)